MADDDTHDNSARLRRFLADSRPDLEGQTSGEVDCDRTACSCQAPDPAAEHAGQQLQMAAKSGCC